MDEPKVAENFLKSLEAFDDATVAKALRERYARGQIFASVGPNTLIAMNPQKITSFYDESVVAEIESEASEALYLERPPHVYSTALSAYQQMMDNDRHQAIIFNGETGSGKSESMRYTLKELMHVIAQKRGDLSIPKKTLAANFLLDAITHSCTEKNKHASLVGKLVELQYNREGGMVGAQIHTFLLDSKRVVQRPIGEGSFHILHSLIESAPETLKESLKLNQGKGFFRYMKDTPFDDHVPFSKIERAMNELDMAPKKQENMFKFLAALLHLGNIDFACDPRVKQGKQLYPTQELEFNEVCAFLQVDAMAFLKALTTRDDIHKEKGNGRIVSLSVDQAHKRRDHLASQLYGHFVQWMCGYLRQLLGAKGYHTIIGLVETPGFSSPGNNQKQPLHFYDYCRNFAHEKLKEFLEGNFLVDRKNDVILETANKECDTRKEKRKKRKQAQGQAADGAQVKTSNREMLDMMVHGTPVSITQLLQEESQYVRQDPEGRYDANWLKKLSDIFKEKNAHFVKASKKEDTFTVRHTLGEVTYSGESCVCDNNPFMTRALFDVLRGSDSAFIHTILADRAITVQDPKGSLYRVLYHQESYSATNEPTKHDAVTSATALSKRLQNVQLLRDTDSTYIVQLETQIDQVLDFLTPMALWQVCCINPQRIDINVRDLSLGPLCEFYGKQYPYGFEDDEQFMDYCKLLLEPIAEAHYYQLQAETQTDESTTAPAKKETMQTILKTLFKTDRERSTFFLSHLDPSKEGFLLGKQSQLFLTTDLHCKLEANIHALPRDIKLQRNEHLRRRRRQNILPTLMDLHGAPDGSSTAGRPSIASSSTSTYTSASLSSAAAARLTTSSHHSNGSTSGSSDHHDGRSHNSVQLMDKENAPFYGTEDWAVMMKQNGGYLDVKRTVLHKKDFQDPFGQENAHETPQDRYTRKIWLLFTWLCTWWIPECVLRCCGRMKDKHVRLAWREKVALVMIIALVSAVLMFWITGFAGLVCPRPKTFTWAAMRSHTTDKDAWVGVHGKALDITAFLPVHLGGRKTIQPFLGHDASPFFPKAPIKSLGKCIANHAAAEKAQLKRNNKCAVGNYKYCHKPSRHTAASMLKMRVGDIGFPPVEISTQKTKKAACFTIGKRVYNVTKYLQDGDFYLRNEVNRIIINHLGEDATLALNRLPDHTHLIPCLDRLFYVGLLTEDYAVTCKITDIILLSTVGCLVSIMVFKFISALQLSAKRDPEHHDKFVMMMVPCYTEGESSLRKTIDSLATMEYDDSHKLIVCVADGVVTGSGNDRPTPQLLLELLGADPTYDPPPFAYQALGDGWRQLNYAKAYSGIYYCAGHRVPYLVIVKSGRPNEGAKSGNRGKRDSQLLLLKFLNKMQYDLPMSPLELEMHRQINDVIGIDPNCYEFLMTVDADTEVKPDSLNRMVSCMVHDTKVMALCGETEVSNAKSSWVTMIQVYEYYMSHHISKAFESLFGSVTCLPGCFSLYRIRLPGQRLAPCLTLPEIIQEYSVNVVDTLHKKNLLHLGEDRYLTTLMLKYFPRMKLSFTADALCRTVVPDRWSVLLSQRRRWINSTIHNLMELSMLKDLCGCCCFSMKFVILIDMFATMVMPTSVAYMFYLIYVSIKSQHAPLLALIIFGSMFGLQALLFLIKKQWQHIGWMVIYIFSIPIFHFIIPIYAFWHFDDFSWGQTRKVQLEDGTEAVIPADDDEEFDASIIPKRRLGELGEAIWAKQKEHRGFHHHQQNRYDSDDDDDDNDNPMMDDINDQDERFRYTSDMTPSYATTTTTTAAMAYGRTMSETGRPLSNTQSMMAITEKPLDSASYFASHEELKQMVEEAQYHNEGDPSDHAILLKINEILGMADWSVLTKRQIREQLTMAFQKDLTEKKAFIDACVDYYVSSKDSI